MQHINRVHALKLLRCLLSCNLLISSVSSLDGLEFAVSGLEALPTTNLRTQLQVCTLLNSCNIVGMLAWASLAMYGVTALCALIWIIWAVVAAASYSGCDSSYSSSC